MKNEVKSSILPSREMVMANNIKFAACKNLDMRSHKAEILYNGRAIRINGKRSETNIYIRIEYSPLGGVTVNFSTIEIDPYLRNQGVFSGIVTEVAKLNFVDYIKIGGVCTQEMLRWCLKRGYTQKDSFDYYLLVKNT